MWLFKRSKPDVDVLDSAKQHVILLTGHVAESARAHFATLATRLPRPEQLSSALFSGLEIARSNFFRECLSAHSASTRSLAS